VEARNTESLGFQSLGI